MHRLQVFTVGRGRNNDFVLSHDSVSRVHAELIKCDAQRLFITDRCSTSGTFVWRDGVWRAVRQEFIAAHENICFGEYVIAASELWLQLRPRPPVSLDTRRGLIRNPETGAIESLPHIPGLHGISASRPSRSRPSMGSATSVHPVR